MESYKVSVIIPCYNSAKYIRKTLNSVLSQTYRPDEILVIDDGSTDETRKILESYQPKIRILSHSNRANLGQGASLNLGIIETKSELIAFLDSDDLWCPGKVKDQVKIFEKHTDVGLVYTNGHVIDEKDNTLYKIFPDKFHEKNVLGEILLKCYIKTPSSVMVKAEIIKKSGFFRENLYSTDHDMWIRMSEITKFYYIPDILIAYRKHRGQISSTRRLWEDGFTILREACKRYPYGLNLRRKRLAVLYYRLGEYDWTHDNYFKALLNFSQAGMFDALRGFGFIIRKIKVLLNSIISKAKQKKMMLKLGKKMESIKIQEIKNIVGKVDGYLTDKEGELLYSLAKNCKGKGVIVEIGSYKGKSTIWLSRGSKAGNKIKIYAIDPHRGSPELREKIQGKIWSYEEFKNNIEKAKVNDIIIPIIATSEEAAKYSEEPVELIFIDGNHSYDHIRLDFELWFPKVVDCGFMAFHDTIWFPGPEKVVKELVFKSKYFRDVGFVGQITFAQKVKQNSIPDRFENRYILLLKNLYKFASKLNLPKPIRMIGRNFAKLIQ